MEQEERKQLVFGLIENIHELKKKCKHADPCDKCNWNCNDVTNCRKCQIVQLLRKDMGLE